ncbi:MAG: hypothetical protein IKA22_09870 [Lentisphaeria bacterium]|nr:hypothetical protein [Lentisphaeria bacterium]
MVSLPKIDEYFSMHLAKDEWNSFANDKKLAAVNMANSDIAGELGETELADDNKLDVGAVAEQALYLLQSPSAVKSAAGNEIASESIDGFGSVSYNVGGGTESKRFICDRAVNFICRRRAQSGGVRLSRG